jgi:hypothetical protein
MAMASGRAVAMVMLGVLSAPFPATAQIGPGGLINPGRDCQTVRQCQFGRKGLYRGCISAYSCRICELVPAPLCDQRARAGLPAPALHVERLGLIRLRDAVCLSLAAILAVCSGTELAWSLEEGMLETFHLDNRIPLGLKLAFTGFMAVLVPVYWHHYGPTNFLYFSDLALFFALFAMWLENPLLASMPAVGVLAAESLWLVDFLAHFAGMRLTGMSDYMFDAGYPLYLRALSLFHVFMPFLLLYLVAKLGYDGRALWSWTVLAWVVLLVCYFFIPAPTPNPGPEPVNINYVYGFSDKAAQTWMPQWAWLLLLMIGMPLLLFAPVHLALQWWSRGWV